MLLFTNSRDYKGTYKVTGFYKGGDYCSNIGEALASCIFNNWQDLSEEERKQIKEILE